MRLAILDDYQGASLRMVDWKQVPGVSVTAFRDHVDDEDEIVARLETFDAVLRIRERTTFTRSLLERLPKLRLILATGMRNAKSIDLETTDRLDIVVCTTDAMHQSTVEIVWGLIIMLARKLPGEMGSVRAGGWQNDLGSGLAGKTLGIVGLGNMGKPVAAIAAILGMRVLAWSPNLTPERAEPFGVTAVPKATLFTESDFITIHMPLAEATRGIVGPAEIAAMKSTAYLVNTSRPQLVDEAALIDALRQDKIAGAGLDVFQVEPLPANSPYRRLHNVIATPHIGFVTEQNYRIFFETSLDNLKNYIEGRPVRRITATEPFLPESQVAVQRSWIP